MSFHKVSDFQLQGVELRRHPRQTVYKSAFLYPVLREAGFAINNVSRNGLSGQCALSLSLRDEVHVSFDKEKFVTAEVRWTKGSTCGLIVEEPLLCFGGVEENELSVPGCPVREPRLAADLSATIVKSSPVLVGTVRNMSPEGMMIEAAGLREGTRLLVKTRGIDMRMGRVQWSSGDMAGVFFDRELSL